MHTRDKTDILSTKLDRVEKEIAEKNTRQSKTFHASGYIDCARKQAYGLLGYKGKSKFVPSYRRDAAFGEAIHGVIQERLIASGAVLELPNFEWNDAIRFQARLRGELSPAIEVPLNEYTLGAEKAQEVVRYRIGGRIDVILKGKTEPIICEIKTVAGKYLTSAYEPYYQDKLDHYESQVQIYMHFWQVKQAIILVVNRDNSSFDEYFCEYDPEFMAKELTRIEEAGALVKQTKLPEPEPERGPCKFCDWQYMCPAGGNK